jgi:long-chain fatty acid transport protein
MSFNKSKIAMAVAALTFSSGAFATNGIIQAGNGMVAHGLGGAGLANAGEASAGADNPALITQTGDAVNVAWSMFSPDRTWTEAGTGIEHPSDAKLFAIPQVAFTSKANDKLSWGIIAYAMGGMDTDYRSGPNFGPTVTPYASSAQTVDLSGMIVAPTLSYGFTKDFSVGASLIIAYENFRVRNLFGMGLTEEGSTTGYGAKLGANWQVNDGIALAAMFQPQISMGSFDWFDSFLQQFGFTGDAQLTLPNEAGIGGKFAIGKSVDIVADVLYYQWSGVDVFKYFGWDDQIVYKVGAEFRPSDKWALRAGFNYGKSPIAKGNQTGTINMPPSAGGVGPKDAPTFNYPFPAVSENHITVGMGYNLDKNVTFNAYYLYSPETKIASTGPSPVESIKMNQNAFGLGINYAVK